LIKPVYNCIYNISNISYELQNLLFFAKIQFDYEIIKYNLVKNVLLFRTILNNICYVLVIILFNLKNEVMKMFKILVLIMISANLSFAEVSGEKSANQCLLEYEYLVKNYNANVDLLTLPYASGDSACMTMVYSKGDYSLWKVRSDEVVNYTNSFITGKSHNYFVYKDNDFHLTVNEHNKSDIYKFFAETE
jgi:hypothetical protein